MSLSLGRVVPEDASDTVAQSMPCVLGSRDRVVRRGPEQGVRVLAVSQLCGLGKMT